MGIRDSKLQPTSDIAKHILPVRFVTSTGLTQSPVALFKPGHEFLITGAQLYASAIAGAVDIDIYSMPSSGIMGTDAGLAIDAAPEKFQISALDVLIGGAFYHKAAATAITFTAAHVVTASKFGIILVQMNASGTVSTKVPAATPTTAMAYATANAALAALPSPAAGNIALGYILIANNTGDWTANTDDMTNGSDLTTATFVDAAVVQGSKAVSSLSPTAATIVSASAPSVAAGWGSPNSTIVVLLTTDGSGAMTNGQLAIEYRPFPLDGEYSRQ